MKTMRELMLQVSEVVNSDLSDAVVRTALRGMLNISVDEEHPFADDPDFCQEDVDDAFERGRAQSAADLETVAAQRDALITKLHAFGNKPPKPLTKRQAIEAEKINATLGWLARKPLPTTARSRVRKWHEREVLPTVVGWYVIRGDGKEIDAYWDGMDFVTAIKRRLGSGMQWSKITAKKGAK